MGKRSERTTNSQIRSALRMLFMKSRERAKAEKDGKYTCARCNAKKSVAKGRVVKIEVHHKNGVSNWNEMYALIREQLLCNSSELEILCKDCHSRETKPDQF